MAHCYILFSENLDRFYIGATDRSLEERLLKHNNASYGSHRYTAAANDWQIFLSIKCENITQAINIERHLKRMKSKIYLQNLIKYPEITQKLLLHYKST